jgi:hypothetical protein
MKKSISKLAYLFGLFLIAGLVACEGPAGPAGPAGQDGVDGVDGTDGTDGADGNANVTIISLSYEDIVWTASSFLGRAANTFSLTETAVNEDIIDHGTVLAFCNLYSTWWALPFTWISLDGTTVQTVIFSYALNTITLWSYQTGGVLDPNGAIVEYRFLLITDNTVTTKSTESEMSVLEKLEDAGVNVDDYYSVMDYFGLEY